MDREKQEVQEQQLSAPEDRETVQDAHEGPTSNFVEGGSIPFERDLD